VRQVRFWGEAFAVWRGDDGALRAVEDRCAHRHLPLSEGVVVGCRLTCQYHGWAYDERGEVVDIPHETFGKKPKFRVRSFAVRERYGMVWVFFGDREAADAVPMPVIDELEGPDPWPCVPLEYVWNAHHSMVMDNVSDYTHGYLHRRLEPFRDPKLVDVAAEADRVVVRYNARIGAGKWMEPFVHRNALGSNAITLTYDYPYHRSNTDDHIKHFIAALPEDRTTTRAFILLFYRALKVPGTPFSVPKRLMKGVIRLGNKLIVDPVFAEDGAALALEQAAWERHWDNPIAELNPQVKAFQELTVRKWSEWLERSAGRSASGGAA
jgi:phenylpropionate dioxygenase-like ring-hydroxylating dioxygenase large terminal subunit